MKRAGIWFAVGAIVLAAALFAAVFALPLMLRGTPSGGAGSTAQEEVYDAYVAYAEARGEQPLGYEEWLESIRGEQGEKGDKGEKGEDGKDGADGADGVGIEDVTYLYLTDPGTGTTYALVTFVLTDGTRHTVRIPCGAAPAAQPVSTAEELQTALSAGADVCLTADISAEEIAFPAAECKIDLNGYTLTLQGTASHVLKDGAALTLRNGELSLPAVPADTGSFLIESGSSLALEGVKYSTTGRAIFVRGPEAAVRIEDSEVYTTGSRAVTTNAAMRDGVPVYADVTIECIRSFVMASSADGDCCGILLNVPGQLTVRESTVTGGRQAVILRGGEALIEDSTLRSAGAFVPAEGEDAFFEQVWNSGHGVPYAALVVGNHSASAYTYPASCTLAGVRLEGPASPAWRYYNVCVYGMTDYPAGLVYDDACTGVAGSLFTGGNAVVTKN